MRRKNLCLIKTIILTFVIGTLILMILTWSSSPHSTQFLPGLTAKLKQLKNEHENILTFNQNENQIKPNDMYNDNDNNNEIKNNKELIKEFVKKDWHDHFSITKQLLQEGLGEKGKPAHLNDNKIKERELYNQNGFNAYLSDHISLNRSVPDIRNPG